MLLVRDAVVALAVGIALSLALFAAPAQATVPPKKCGSIEIGRKDYKVRAHLIGCDRARKGSRRFLATGDHGKRWNCTRYPPQQTKIAFTCRKGRKDYYAIRT